MVNETTPVEADGDPAPVSQRDPAPVQPLVILAADDDLVCVDDLCLPPEDRP